MSDNDSNSVLDSVKNYMIPNRSDSRKEKFRKIVFLFSIVVFIASLVQLGLFLRSKGIEEKYSSQMQEYAPHLSDEPSPATPAKPSDPDTTKKTDPQKPQAQQQRTIQPWANKLINKNKDVIGWVSINSHTDKDGKPYINSAVVKGKNNDEYLYLNLDKKYSMSGIPFADSACTVDEKGQSDNITLYGHHMGYIGTGFTHIHEYKQGVDFLKSNPVITFNTIYDNTNQKYAIVGCFIANAFTSVDNGSIFKYWNVRNFSDKSSDFDKWISEVRKRSWYSSDINCTDKDKYITLSTCSDECWGIRWVIVAKKLTDKDDLDKIVQSYKAKPDNDIYFPALWVNKLGNKKVYYGWDY